MTHLHGPHEEGGHLPQVRPEQRPAGPRVVAEPADGVDALVLHSPVHLAPVATTAAAARLAPAGRRGAVASGGGGGGGAAGLQGRRVVEDKHALPRESLERLHHHGHILGRVRGGLDVVRALELHLL